MKIVFIIFLSMILFPSTSFAQLFVSKQIYPGVYLIKAKYYNGSGRGSYSGKSMLDNNGRVLEHKSYRNKKLLSEDKYVYNTNGDLVQQINSFVTIHLN